MKLHELAKRLYPINRSLTGDGVRESLRILQEHLPLEIHEIPTGTQVYDWEIPREWNLTDAYIKGPDGRKVVDFKDHNLHVVGYSVPFQGTLTLEELSEHLYSLPDRPDLIPYITSYYKERWGFCLTHRQREALPEGNYEVCVDSSLEPGHLTYADLLIPGEVEDEILLSSYVCHPSMANNELSGPIVTTALAKELLERKNYYSYRIVLVPETIGAIAYIHENYDDMKERVKGGYVVTCCGDDEGYSYLHSRKEGRLADRAALQALKGRGLSFKEYSFLECGSDNCHYDSPGVDLGIGSIMRSKYNEYPTYHTSGDDLDFISEDGLQGALNVYLDAIEIIENNFNYTRTTICDPKLDKRGLYPTLSTPDSTGHIKRMMNFLAYCDGERDLIGISEKIGVPALELIPLAKTLLEKEVIKI